jgi:hypothetical protein
MSPSRKSTARKSPGGTSPRLQIVVGLRMLHTGLRLRRIGSILLKLGDILGRTPYGALYHPCNDGLIDCGITSENAGDQIPNHLIHVLNVSTTFIKLAFVNVRINALPFHIYLNPGVFLYLGNDNLFEVIDPMYEDNEDNDDDNDVDEYNDNEDKDNDAERDRKGAVVDESKEEEDVNNPSLSHNRRDEEEEEEEEEQLTPKTSHDDVDPNAADAPKTSTDDDGPNAAKASPVRGNKDPHKMMRLFYKGPARFRRIAPVFVASLPFQRSPLFRVPKGCLPLHPFLPGYKGQKRQKTAQRNSQRRRKSEANPKFET